MLFGTLRYLPAVRYRLPAACRLQDGGTACLLLPTLLPACLPVGSPPPATVVVDCRLPYFTTLAVMPDMWDHRCGLVGGCLRLLYMPALPARWDPLPPACLPAALRLAE